MEQQLLVVQLALDAPHHRVADRTLVAQLEQLPPLRSEQLAREPLEGGGLRLHRTVDDAIRVALQAARAMAVALAGVAPRAGGHPRRGGQPLRPRPRPLGGLSPRGDRLALLRRTRLPDP